MGTPMARNLIELGHEVTLFNRTREKAELLAGPGVRVAASVADAVGNVQAALTMVTGDPAEEALTWGPGGLLESLPPGAIHLCMSSIGVGLSRRMAEAHAQAGQGYVAAPVLGKPSQASARQTWILAGGPEVQVNRCLTLLEALGRGITRVGEKAELAHALKLGANTLTIAVVEALAEVLAFGEKAGMAPSEYLRILNTGLFKSPLLDAFGGMIARRDHDPSDQTLDLAAKDLALMLQSAHGMDVTLPMAAPLLAEVENARNLGLGEKDLTVLAMVRRMEVEHAPAPAPHQPGRSRRHADPPPPRSVPPAPPRALEPPGPMAPLVAPPPPPQGGPVPSVHPLIPPTPAAEAPRAQATGKSPSRQERRKAAQPRKKGEPERRKVQPRDPRKPAVVVPVVPKPIPVPMPRPLPAVTPPKVPVAAIPKVPSVEPPAPPPPPPAVPAKSRLEEATFPAKGPKGVVDLALSSTTHFEEKDGMVWAWNGGQCLATSWRSFPEVELALSQVLFVKIQSRILLNPMTVQHVKPLFAGRGKVTVTGGQELTAGREATRRLLFLLGM
jgi:3-hydroxyisobutyrate dehydrogenase-like beta-hydroxyacid dehydrogenase